MNLDFRLKLAFDGLDDSPTPTNRDLWLYTAAASGSVDGISFLLEKGLSPFSCDDDGKTPLHHAAAKGHAPVCNLLLAHISSRAGIEACATCLNLPDKQGRTAFMLAVRAGHIALGLHLLACGTDAARADFSGNAGFHYAAFAGDVRLFDAVCDRLLNAVADRGHDIDARNAKGETPLMIAATHGHLDIVRAALRRNADPTLALHDGRRADNLAAADNHAIAFHLAAARDARHEAIMAAGILRPITVTRLKISKKPSPLRA